MGLREARMARGWTVAQVAAAVNVAASTVSTAERGRSRPSPEVAAALAAVLGVHVDEIRPPVPPPAGSEAPELDRLVAERWLQRRHRNALARAGYCTAWALLVADFWALSQVRALGAVGLKDLAELRARPPEWARVQGTPSGAP